MRPALSALVLAALIAVQTGSVQAGETRAVVELFTSQGCSSSPPASGVLASLARDPNVIVLSLPVDYWDYLGWKDTLAQAGFTARQRAYAQARGDRQVFTPQAVVNGGSAVVGTDRAALDRTLSVGPALPVSVDLKEAGGSVAVDVGSGSTTGTVWLMPVVRDARVAIERGENRGRTMAYVNVVRAFVRVGAWSGQPTRYEVARSTAHPPGADGYVVLVQADRGGAGRILGAAKGPGL